MIGLFGKRARLLRALRARNVELWAMLAAQRALADEQLRAAEVGAENVAADECEAAARYAEARAAVFKRIAERGGTQHVGGELAGMMRIQLDVFAQDLRAGLHRAEGVE